MILYQYLVKESSSIILTLNNDDYIEIQALPIFNDEGVLNLDIINIEILVNGLLYLKYSIFTFSESAFNILALDLTIQCPYDSTTGSFLLTIFSDKEYKEV
jgi:hypothetical protein